MHMLEFFSKSNLGVHPALLINSGDVAAWVQGYSLALDHKIPGNTQKPLPRTPSRCDKSRDVARSAWQYMGAKFT